MYERYLFLARDGVQARKRNLDACKTWRETQEEQSEINAVVKRIRSNPAVYQPFPEVPQVSAWLHVFKTDRLRYPLLIILGPSASGKTEFAKGLFQSPLELKVGDTEVFPAKMMEFKRHFHDALILDDVRDLNFLISHQEKLQGKYDSRIEFATTQGGTCFYTKYLFKIPTAACFLCLGELVCPPLEHTCEPWCIAAACFLCLGELVWPALEHTCEPWCIAAACFLCLGELGCPPLEHTCEPQSFAAQPPIDPDCSVLCPSWPVMVVVSESVHPRGLDFQNQRKVVILRDVHGLTFPEIAKQVKTLFGGRPSARSCCLYYHSFSGKVGRRCCRYKNCGRNAWKLTRDVQRFLLQKLKQLRKTGLCTCAILQREVAREQGVALEISTIRKYLHSKGYKWLPRAQTRKYTAAQMRARVAFAQSSGSRSSPLVGKIIFCNGWMRFDHSPSRAHWSVEFLEDIPVTHVAAQERALSATASWTRHVQQAMRPWPVHSSVGRAQSRWLCYSAVPSTEKALRKWMGGCCQGRKASRCD